MRKRAERACSCVQKVSHSGYLRLISSDLQLQTLAPKLASTLNLENAHHISPLINQAFICRKHQAPIPPSPSRPSSPKISCCKTMLYTLAFSSVNTVVVFRSRPLSASRISAEGFEASSARIPDSCEHR